uniref:Uncharacterized protein n=1 Tax=Myoviridae sp. ctBCv9 TaxID=2825045 RepID=A0A8S5U6D5_9CAUD|nr:MAG TPA: hypothetical protein [Myoviridae sp. ctBCv9]
MKGDLRVLRKIFGSVQTCRSKPNRRSRFCQYFRFCCYRVEAGKRTDT